MTGSIDTSFDDPAQHPVERELLKHAKLIVASTESLADLT